MKDRQTTFSNEQAVTAAGTNLSTDIYDTGVEGLNINTNRDLQIFIGVVEAFVGGTNVAVNLIESSNADMSSPDVIARTGTVVTANLTAGARLLATALPRTSKRYLALQIVSVGTFTAGTLFGGLVRDIEDVAFPAQNTGYVG